MLRNPEKKKRDERGEIVGLDCCHTPVRYMSSPIRRFQLPYRGAGLMH